MNEQDKVFGNITYGKYTGSVVRDFETGEYYGRILNTDDLIMYRGETLDDLYKDFVAAVLDYEAPDGFYRQLFGR
jgi:hypothetical protein